MKVKVGKSVIGNGLPPVFWPDIDVYFKGDVQRANHLIDVISSCGLSTVKGAVLQRVDLCLNSDIPTRYFVPGQGLVSESYRKIIERHVVPLEKLKVIYGGLRDRGLDLVLSVYDEEGLDFALEMDAAAIKIPSSNIVHAPLIKAVARSGRPMAIDTGRSTASEIERAVGWARSAGGSQLIVQHSPPGPPAPAKNFHLRMLTEMENRFGCPTGLSDHFPGEDMLLLAVAMGVSALEKGVCPDDVNSDIDLSHALRISDLPRVWERLQFTYEALGAPMRPDSLVAERAVDRMGLIAKVDLNPGDILNQSTVAFAFPTAGIPVEDWERVEGRKCVVRVEKGKPISYSEVEKD